MNIKQLNDNVKISILAILAVFVMCSASWAATYYVDSSIASSGDGSEGNPWKNISDISGLHDGDTILFKRGESWNEQLSAVSGSASNHVIYSAYGSGDKPIIRNFYADGDSYIDVKNIEFQSNGSKYPVYVTNTSHHIKFSNVDAHAESGCTSYAAFRIYENSHHIELDGCDIYHKNSGSKDGLSLKGGAQYCLIQNSTIGTAGHSALAIVGNDGSPYTYETNYNVIYNNTIWNPRDRAVEIQYNANWNIISNNTIRGCDSGSCNESGNTRSFKLITHHNIVRNNIIHANEGSSNVTGLSLRPYQYGSVPTDSTTYNHVYNNTITGISRDPWALDDNEPGAGCEIQYNQFKNNISYTNGSDYQLRIDNDATISDNYFTNNLFYNSGVTNVLRIDDSNRSVAYMNTNDSNWTDNLQDDPDLDGNYVPNEGSPAIDAGDFLTEITSESGSGNTFTVKDALYFTDGFGIIQGDIIQIGSTTATIDSINYTTNKITVSTSISWTKGQPVSLPYRGNRPDIGAFEYEYGEGLSPPSGLRIIAVSI